MGRDRAAYMREYRAKKARAEADVLFADILATARAKLTLSDLDALPECEEARTIQARAIHELEDEVARLKRELAARPAGPSFNSRPFRPVPK